VTPPSVDVLGYGVRVAAGSVGDAGGIVGGAAPAHTYAIITDANVGPRWLPSVMRSFERTIPDVRVVSHQIRAGESEKTRATWSLLTDWMLSVGCGRDTTVVALGGGVVIDLAGFVAATFMRGVPFVPIPTTLLGMVDAAIGGKTGVDTPVGKNLVGAFHQPAAVLVDPEVLTTLPAFHVRAGMAEVLKHGAIADRDYFNAASAFASAVHHALEEGSSFPWSGEEAGEIIARSIAIKTGVVARDERESGLRQVLNAGHTVAHAIELATDYRWLHGAAVSVGLVAEAVIAERSGVARAGTAAHLRTALDAAGLPTRLPTDVSPEALVAAMHTDKKVRGGRLGFAFLSEIGCVAGSTEEGWTTFLPDRDVRTVLGDLAIEGSSLPHTGI
jgi:3-dehydroquinate synthase